MVVKQVEWVVGSDYLRLVWVESTDPLYMYVQKSVTLGSDYM